MTARPGQRVRLDGYATHETRPGCPSVPAAAIELVTPPRGGRIEQRREFLARKVLAAPRPGLADFPGSPCYALAGDRLLLSPTRSGIEEALDRLASAYDASQRFIADAAHELRTPLRTIIGFSEIICIVCGSIYKMDLCQITVPPITGD